MKIVFCALLAALTLLAAAVVPAYAVDSSKSYLFELSIDGGDTKHAAAGDIVTVLLTVCIMLVVTGRKRPSCRSAPGEGTAS